MVKLVLIRMMSDFSAITRKVGHAYVRENTTSRIWRKVWSTGFCLFGRGGIDHCSPFCFSNKVFCHRHGDTFPSRQFASEKSSGPSISMGFQGRPLSIHCNPGVGFGLTMPKDLSLPCGRLYPAFAVGRSPVNDRTYSHGCGMGSWHEASRHSSVRSISPITKSELDDDIMMNSKPFLFITVKFDVNRRAEERNRFLETLICYLDDSKVKGDWRNWL